MNVEVFLRNKLERQIKWNGQPFKFIRHKRNDFHEITDEVEKEFNFNGVFHEGGGYGGMLNIEMYGRDGGKTAAIILTNKCKSVLNVRVRCGYRSLCV